MLAGVAEALSGGVASQPPHSVRTWGERPLADASGTGCLIMISAADQHMVRPGGYCPPRHPARFDPSFIPLYAIT